MVNDATWERGLMLYRAKKVVALDIEPVRLHWQLLGEVQGTQRLPYEVSVEMALMPDGEVDFWDSDCSCPVGSQCKHGVALMLEAADQGLQLLEESGIASAVSDLLTPPNAEQLEVARAAAAARAQEVAREQAEAQLLRWLQALDNASGQPQPSPAKGTARERADQFLYLLSVIGAQGPAPQLVMEAVISYTKLTGGWAKPTRHQDRALPGPTGVRPGAGRGPPGAAADARHARLEPLHLRLQLHRHAQRAGRFAGPAAGGQHRSFVSGRWRRQPRRPASMGPAPAPELALAGSARPHGHGGRLGAQGQAQSPQRQAVPEQPAAVPGRRARPGAARPRPKACRPRNSTCW